jgi:hypothetical protein
MHTNAWKTTTGPCMHRRRACAVHARSPDKGNIHPLGRTQLEVIKTKKKR